MSAETAGKRFFSQKSVRICIFLRKRLRLRRNASEVACAVTSDSTDRPALLCQCSALLGTFPSYPQFKRWIMSPLPPAKKAGSDNTCAASAPFCRPPPLTAPRFVSSPASQVSFSPIFSLSIRRGRPQAIAHARVIPPAFPEMNASLRPSCSRAACPD